MSVITIILLSLAILTCVGIKLYVNAQWAKKPLHNFPFIYRGKEYWYSRSVAVTHFIFAKNASDKWCVLANQRGKGAESYQGYWNCPCGYLDFDECGEEAAQRETFEETNVFIKKENIKFWNVISSPKAHRQNVSIHYYTVLDEKCEDFELSNINAEKNEVKSLKWVAIDEKDEQKWAFNHSNHITEIFNSVITNNL